jgi:hypothetical protein
LTEARQWSLEEEMTAQVATATSAIAIACIVVAAGGAVRAEPRPAPLEPIAPERVAALAPVLVDRDLVLLEFDGVGGLKQLSALTLVAAPPETVREAVIHPERYPEFVRNMKRSRVAAEPGGTLWHEYAISYRVYTVEGRHRYVFLPKRDGDAVAPVEMYDPDADGTRHCRWEFVPAGGGATVLALYGFTRIAHDRFSSRYLDKAPTLEAGFALIPFLTLMYSMKARAEKVSGGRLALPAGKKASWEFLLDRGTVAVLMSSRGRVREVNLIERSKAPVQWLFAVAAEPARWAAFVPTMQRSTPVGPRGLEAVEPVIGPGEPSVDPIVEIEQALPLMSWTTRWAYRREGSSVDLLALDGDLRGGHLRWDVRQDAAGRSQLVLRAAADFQNGSMLLREVYKLEPYLEYGFDVALNLLLLQSVRRRAEQLSASP